jgi:DNA-binding transcriptional MerR regulator
METTTPTLIRKKELAQRLSVSPRTIDNWVSRRIIPYIQLSSRFNLYDPEAVIEALRKTYQIDAMD